MTVTIYVEGGGKKDQGAEARCRGGFRGYCNKITSPGRSPRIVACGGRDDAFKRFKIASESGNVCALLVDSEGPVPPDISAQTYLSGDPDGWQFPDKPNYRIFLMVQAMEAWFLADRDSIAEYFGSGFRPKALPGQEVKVEAIPKNDLVPSIERAIAGTKRKGKFHKVRDGFELLAKLDPKKVEAGSPHAAKFNEFLRSL